MLSYQHIYHAGNMADVHKHALLAVMLDYMAAKAKPLTYIETHAGRGLYRLDSAEAVKTGEAMEGVGRLSAVFPTGHPYARCLASVRAQYGETAYPGSPLLAAHLLRPEDHIHLAEMHPREHAALVEVMASHPASVRREDGFRAALALCPPRPRRGLLLIDPSYEVKTDYAAIPDFVAKLRRKWNVGVVALWYPLLADAPHGPMLKALCASDPGAFRHEVVFGPARHGHRMTGSGMFIVNPTYGLADAAAKVSAIFGSSTVAGPMA